MYTNHAYLSHQDIFKGAEGNENKEKKADDEDDDEDNDEDEDDVDDYDIEEVLRAHQKKGGKIIGKNKYSLSSDLLTVPLINARINSILAFISGTVKRLTKLVYFD